MKNTISREEDSERLRKNLEKQLPKDMKNRDEHIEFTVKDFIGRGPLGPIGTTFAGDMVRKEEKITVPINQFIQWVSKDEYESRLRYAQSEEAATGNEEIWFLDAWNFLLENDERNKKCRICPLSTYLGTRKNTVVEELKLQLKRKKSGEKHKLLHGIYKQLVRSNNKEKITNGKFRNLVETDYPHLSEIVEFVAQSLDSIPQYKTHAKRLRSEYNQWGSPPDCHRGSSYSHWSTFFEFISRCENFEILTTRFFESEEGTCGEIQPSLLDKLNKELKKSREILENTRVPAINIYDRRRKLIGTITYDTGWLYGNEQRGYGLGLEGKEEAITVVYKAASIFDIPISVRREILDKEGLDGIMMANADIHEQQPRFYFKEISRRGDTFYGKTINGTTIELPPEISPTGERYTPFSGIQGSEKIGRLEYTNASPMKGFGYLQRLLEKYAGIASKFDIPIKAS